MNDLDEDGNDRGSDDFGEIRTNGDRFSQVDLTQHFPFEFQWRETDFLREAVCEVGLGGKPAFFRNFNQGSVRGNQKLFCRRNTDLQGIFGGCHAVGGRKEFMKIDRT